MTKQSYYVTTPIYYVNERPHIGNAYTTIAADAVARYYRLQGRDVFFLTGTDEHGINNARSARRRGVAPQAHVDELAAAFQEYWRTLDVGYDRFIRTTEVQHKRGALELWRRLEARGDLYRATYAGPYCPRCEAYYQEEELDGGGNCPVHGLPCEVVAEENTFFRLSRYQKELEHLVAQTDFVQPAFRRNEALAVLRQGLRDFSVTRKIDWGVPAPGAPGEVLYVWVDALANYLTGVGFPDDEATFRRYWPADVHLVGKDILRFHCLYWPALLLSAGLPLPRRVFAHGWLLSGGRKIGKSAGNAVDPLALAGKLGADAVRYCLLRAAPFGQDGDFSQESAVARYNADLANDFGNLVQRSTTLIARYHPSPGRAPGGAAPEPGAPGGPERRLRAQAAALPERVAEAFERLAIDEAAAAVGQLVTAANRYAEETAPWVLARSGPPEALGTALFHLAAAARLAAWFFRPFIPSAAAEAHARLAGGPPETAGGTFDALPPGTVVRTGAPLFPRYPAGTAAGQRVGSG